MGLLRIWKVENCTWWRESDSSLESEGGRSFIGHREGVGTVGMVVLGKRWEGGELVVVVGMEWGKGSGCG